MSQHPCLADLLPARCEGRDVGEVAALLLAVTTLHHGVHLHGLDPVLLGYTQRSILSQHSNTGPAFPLHLHGTSKNVPPALKDWKITSDICILIRNWFWL